MQIVFVLSVLIAHYFFISPSSELLVTQFKARYIPYQFHEFRYKKFNSIICPVGWLSQLHKFRPFMLSYLHPCSEAMTYN